MLKGDQRVRSAHLLVSAVAFPPTNLLALLGGHGLPGDPAGGTSVFAETPDESLALLVAALGDWMDFYFLPNPKRFLLYADHDEYITLFAHRKASLSRIKARLTEAGFDEVTAYVREIDDL
jgi:hypothetical protein